MTPRASGPRRRAALRTLVGVVGALAMLLAVQVGASGPASAHSRLESSTPAADGVVDVAPAAITLTFSDPVSTTYSRVTVTGPGSASGTWQQGDLTSLGDTASQAIGPLGEAGVYSVAWRVVSVDGHPVSGAFSFTLTTAGTGVPKAAAPVGAADAAAPVGSASAARAAAPAAASRWSLAGGLAGAALALAGVAVVVGRRPLRLPAPTPRPGPPR